MCGKLGPLSYNKLNYPNLLIKSHEQFKYIESGSLGREKNVMKKLSYQPHPVWGYPNNIFQLRGCRSLMVQPSDENSI